MSDIGCTIELSVVGDLLQNRILTKLELCTEVTSTPNLPTLDDIPMALRSLFEDLAVNKQYAHIFGNMLDVKGREPIPIF